DTNLASTPDGVTPLFLALRQGNLALASRLLDLGANINVLDAGGETPLTEAEKQRPPNYAAIRLLLSRKASPTTSAADLTLADATGQTPLQIAAASVSGPALYIACAELWQHWAMCVLLGPRFLLQGRFGPGHASGLA